MNTLRSTLLFAIVLSFTLLLTEIASAQYRLPERDSSQPRTSPNGWVGQTIGTHDVEISYGRPFVRGREVFGSLQKFGNVWRAGANEATAIVIPADAKIEGEDLAAGVYSLFTVPGESEWTVIFNGQADIWGTQHDPEHDVLHVTVTPREAPHQEMLVYEFDEVEDDSATIVLHWATTQVPFTISFAGSDEM